MDGTHFDGRFRISPPLPTEQAVAEVRAWIALREAQANAPSAACPFVVYRTGFRAENQGRAQAVDVWAQELVSHLATKGHTCSGLIEVRCDGKFWALTAVDVNPCVRYGYGYVTYSDFQPVESAAQPVAPASAEPIPARP